MRDGSLFERSNFRQERGINEVNLSGMASVGLRAGKNHELKLLGLYNRGTDDRVTLQQGLDAELSSNIEAWELRYISRQLLLAQLLGEHRRLFGSSRLRWNAFFGNGQRSQPDSRSTLYSDQGGGPFLWQAKTTSGARIYSDLDQLDYGAGGDFRFPLPLLDDAWATFGASFWAAAARSPSGVFAIRVATHRRKRFTNRMRRAYLTRNLEALCAFKSLRSRLTAIQLSDFVQRFSQP